MDVSGSSVDVGYKDEQEEQSLYDRVDELEEQLSMLEAAFKKLEQENCKLRELLRV